ncbi:cytochrome C [Bradyrhizobium sp. WBOS7]|uniref:Cytochrome C n=2 Tax=Nitrobacteraceae TaxID=41294 RepID=A0AAE9NFA2_9BRAD|nr:cytochrome C [Bradyrhizobium sp. WBOS2]MDD1569156.1 cytochrome C [Bradyrhizobium sp. WBOS1]MDD1576275.1 cytochrome C [Bradyrhizobium sp. WBOS7]MDD1602529.1 cytochrome C [Bradyrhizobium sp. WBOS16]UUO37962.1 cytochrome C [Bradyrhizobium sp. WBOS01]UUO44128.1 cytochrome C [Bradyrhizobium sp. WBOS02]UUO54536.1 cytochrome C [Bradyrhizobium sp. WBOS07]UUO68537.1 cytochrome C [Bradyrhizobium betae]
MVRSRMSKSLKLMTAALLACALGAPALAQQKADAKGGPRYHIGRAPTADEIRGWDIDVRPDGQGLPEGKGTAAQGEKLFMDNCASCHGEFGEGSGRWPVLAGGKGSLTSDNPVKTVGSYWPYASTVFDYVRHAMPYGNTGSLSVDEYYALVAYVLYLNDVVTDQNLELNKKTLATIKMPNEQGFVMDDRASSEKAFWQKDPCMKNCIAPVKITGRAAAIDVTPEDGKDKKSRGVE